MVSISSNKKFVGVHFKLPNAIFGADLSSFSVFFLVTKNTTNNNSVGIAIRLNLDFITVALVIDSSGFG